MLNETFILSEDILILVCEFRIYLKVNNQTGWRSSDYWRYP